MNLVVTRFLLIVFCTYCGGFIAMRGFNSIRAMLAGCALGFVFSLIAFFLDQRIRKIPLKTIICGSIGAFVALVIANLFSYSFLSYQLDQSYSSFLLYLSINGFFGYLGLAIGGNKGDELDISGWPVIGGKRAVGGGYKILDTSVIIDGRIADLWETGFLEGIIIIPQFVLRELVNIADSSDTPKKTRGRRGFEILNKLQKQTDIEVRIVERDFPKIKNVDDKIVALAKSMDASIITNDYNLDKIAEIQGINVLNVNQLASAVKPLILPGESLNVLIQREGKDPFQGVAYLNDGTPVIVENAKKHLGRQADITATSVLQTTSGRMIFAVLKGENSKNFNPKSPAY